MAQEHDLEPTSPRVLDEPGQEERALVFAFRDTEAVRAAAKSFSGDDTAARGLDRVRAYAARMGAPLEPLFARESEFLQGEKWKLALPKSGSQDGDLALIYHLRVASHGDQVALERDLRSDPRVGYVHRPAIFHPLLAPSIVDVKAGHQWALDKCGFGKEVWDRLEKGQDPGPIGIIDAGGEISHPELDGIIDGPKPTDAEDAPSSHAMEVAGVIAAIRGNGDEQGKGMAGCCSARVRIYNAWTTKGFDSKRFYRALEAVAAARLPVLNLSIGSRTSDATTDQLIRKCIERGVVVVAAMGDFAKHGSPPLFPAAHCGVIAVGGTSRSDRKTRISSTGCHIWISAPGEDILTLSGDDGLVEADGTSYATAMVTAAVWLARRAKPGLGPAEIREILAKSVDGKSVPNGGHSAELGFGRLDMARLADLVAPVCGS